MTDARFTQQYVEALEDEADSDARFTQQSVEPLQHEGPSETQVFHQYVEVIYLPTETCSLLETDDVLLVDATYQSTSVTLMDPAPIVGHIYRVKRIDNSSNSVILDPGTLLIDDLPSFDLAPYQSLAIVTTGSAWYIVAAGSE